MSLVAQEQLEWATHLLCKVCMIRSLDASGNMLDSRLISLLMGTWMPEAHPLPVSSSTHWFRTEGAAAVALLNESWECTLGDCDPVSMLGVMSIPDLEWEPEGVVITLLGFGALSGNTWLPCHGGSVDPIKGNRYFEAKHCSAGEGQRVFKLTMSLQYKVPARMPINDMTSGPGGALRTS